MSGPDRMKVFCSATSKQTGKGCRNSPIPGGTVCRFHGGAAPQVKDKARQRLEALLNKAIDQVAEALEAEQLLVSKEGDVVDRVPAYRIRLRAAKEVLDRVGPSAKAELEISGGMELRVNVSIDDEIDALIAKRLAKMAGRGKGSTPVAPAGKT